MKGKSKSSWKTTLWGLLGSAGAVCIALAQVFPQNKGWAVAGAVATALGIGGLGVTARDNNRTSEDIGLR